MANDANYLERIVLSGCVCMCVYMTRENERECALKIKGAIRKNEALEYI